jgi:hypothetical protein
MWMDTWCQCGGGKSVGYGQFFLFPAAFLGGKALCDLFLQSWIFYCGECDAIIFYGTTVAMLFSIKADG